MSHTVSPVGTRAVIVDLPDLDTVMAWHASLVASPLPGQVEAIAAARTVLVCFDAHSSAIAGLNTLRNFQPHSSTEANPREVTIDVVYDGEDLADVAELMGISIEELITRHTQQQWLAAFGGFAPGFTYCVPAAGDQSYTWDVPRRSSPRTAVPAGAVGLAGQFSAVYPRTSPGGWQLLGHTTQPMWDTNAEQPALLQPGDTVRYRQVRESISVETGSAEEATAGARVGASQNKRPIVPARQSVKVLDAGLQTLFQDTGRAGHGDIGVNGSGAIDRASAWAANDVVGNASSATVLENIGGIELEALVDTAVCVTGARANVSIDRRTFELGAPVEVKAGQTLKIEPVGGAGNGLRSYVAVRGGLVTDEVLGSNSTDILSGLGPQPVATGDVLKAGRRTARASVGTATTNPFDGENVLRCVAGPRDDWFGNAELQRFTELEWTVTGQSNRVGLRLALPAGSDGTEGTEGTEDTAPEPLQRNHDGELASEGMVSGSIQVPPNGLPVVFLADHPVTGGYPVIATVIDKDLDKAGQLAPGDTVRFELIDFAQQASAGAASRAGTPQTQ
ncbi:carboxyltransferase domain-containing protein [uncultured Corynebacterium sp.]|uniref:5-oxoprolinase subunit B/C family protein n=1 Tax=uncultured Corynebacterium sp. TaxID=159447 RepID=UPI0025EED97E|nr:carboxyltransferase domain-containing protein [uncultured Corynebacterium sp.]